LPIFLPVLTSNWALWVAGAADSGIWQGHYLNQTFPWLRWWDAEGNLLLTGEERAEQEKQRADQTDQRADQADQRAARLAAELRRLGINPDDL
jgi:hypothetical protein